MVYDEEKELQRFTNWYSDKIRTGEKGFGTGDFPDEMSHKDAVDEFEAKVREHGGGIPDKMVEKVDDAGLKRKMMSKLLDTGQVIELTPEAIKPIEAREAGRITLTEFYEKMAEEGFTKSRAIWVSGKYLRGEL